MIAATRAFLRLSRTHFLPGGALGVALGTLGALYAGARFDWRAWLAAQCAISTLQLATHYSNDYYDRTGDRAATRTRFSGGSGVLQEGLLAPRVALVAALLCGGCGLGACAVLLGSGRPLAAALGALIAALAWSYSAPPFALHRRGGGEWCAALVVGFLVPLFAAAAQTNAVAPITAAAALPGLAAMFVLMYGVEFPDLRADAAAGKRTALVRHGPRALRRSARWIVAVFAFAALAVALGAPLGYGLLLVPALGAALPLGRRLREAARGRRVDAGALAARSVAFFVLVESGCALGFAAALRWPL